MKMKQLFLTILLFAALCFPAHGASLDEWMLAEYLVQPQGRLASSGNNVLLEIYYSDGTSTAPSIAEAGVSASTLATDEKVLNLYEAGVIVTSVRFSIFDGSIDTGGFSIGDLVDSINADTSEYWNAEVGPDAYDAMPSRFLYWNNVKDANVPSEEAVEIAGDCDAMRGISVGAKGETGARVRLKRVSEVTRITATTYPHWVDIYDGDNKVWTTTFDTDHTNDAVSPFSSVTDYSSSMNTVDLADIASKGLGTQNGNGLCVVVQYPTAAEMSMGGPNDTATGSVSILYDIIKP